MNELGLRAVLFQNLDRHVYKPAVNVNKHLAKTLVAVGFGKSQYAKAVAKTVHSKYTRPVRIVGDRRRRNLFSVIG